MFGKIVGAGQAGFVFENPKNPDSYFKIVALPEQPLETMPLRSTKARLGAINQNQAELFFRLYQENLDIPQLPKVLAFYTGRVTPKLRRNLLNAALDSDLQNLVRNLRTDQKIAVWEMERIPCLSENEFCERYPTRQPLNNPDYQNLLNTMLDLGFVVRDVANPENFGYREDGTQVFYDPIVAPWPVQEVTKVSDPNRYARFVASFGPDQISTTRRAIQSGDYFGWYHSGGVMEAEQISCPPATQDSKLNSENRQAAFETLGYGPRDVSNPGDYWEKQAKRMGKSVDQAKKSNCGNCVAYDVSNRIKSCGVSDNTGYCWMHHFVCQSARTCNTWASGGPITSDKVSQEWQTRAFGKSTKAAEMTNTEDAELVDQYQDAQFVIMARTPSGNDYNVSPLALYHSAWKAPNRRRHPLGVEGLVEEIAWIFDNLGTAPNPYALDIFLLNAPGYASMLKAMAFSPTPFSSMKLDLVGTIKYGNMEASYPYEDLAKLSNRRLDFERSAEYEKGTQGPCWKGYTYVGPSKYTKGSCVKNAETLQDNYFPEGDIYNPNQSGALNWIKPAPYLDLWASFYGDIVEWLQNEIYEMDDEDDEGIEMWARLTPDLETFMDYVQENNLDPDGVLPEIIEESPLYWPYSQVSKPQLLKSRNAGFMNFMRRAYIKVSCGECYGKGYINRTAGEYDEHEWTEECENCDVDGEVEIDNSDNLYYRQHKEEYSL